MNNHNLETSKLFDDKSYIKIGVVTLAIFVASFGYWIVFSNLDSAAIAPGIISVEGQRKSVEHLEGGIVESVLVKDGDSVKVNQPLIRLSSIAAQSRFSQLNLQYYSLLAQIERLHHEREKQTSLSFSENLLSAASSLAALSSVLNTQEYLFQARVNLRDSQVASVDAKLSGIISEQETLIKKIEQESLALSFLERELEMNNRLLKGGYSSQLRIYELRRNQAQFTANLIELKGRLRSNELAQLEAKKEKASLEFQYIANIGNELQEVSKSKDAILEQLTQAKDVLTRVVITSPHHGKVVGLTVFNRGDVISPGETLLEVVPNDEQLIVVATLKPEDIDVVKIGQEVLIRLSAYNFRTTPPIQGRIIHVAADRLMDSMLEQDKTGFTIKIRIDKQQLNKLDQVNLHPGMPAEVYIQLDSRSVLDYLLEPLKLDIFRAFRES